ncbi:MAG TPA: phosphotransferase, partial [Pseudonocardia sp.]|nr:phosphotransferase [Pseudonocardia sp.]
VPRDTAPPGTWLEEAEEHYREVAGHVPPASRGAVEVFLAGGPPADPGALAFCHNDLGAEHLLVDAGGARITGVIDWADAAIADPAYDLALVHRDLGPEVLDLTLAHYDPPWDEADRDRAVFYSRCALLEDLAYGVGTGAGEYAEAALAHLGRTFAEQ